MDDVASIIDKERAQSYKREKFEQIYESFDEDDNGFLSKAEMATLIKKTFKKNSKKWTYLKNLKIIIILTISPNHEWSIF